MTRIVPTLKTRHSRGTLGKQIDDLALTLVTPLRANDDNEFTHGSSRSVDPRLTT